VEALRRGWLGLTLFVAALVLMPILVLSYHYGLRHNPSTGAATTGGSGFADSVDPYGSQSRFGLGPLSTGAVAPGRTAGILAFDGVKDGDVLRGLATISLRTTGSVGRVNYTLTGFPDFRWSASGPPYLFSPHANGWRTDEAADGQYVLTATPVDSQIPPRSVSFEVRNHTAATAAGPSADAPSP
jgi:hypothetical protein